MTRIVNLIGAGRVGRTLLRRLTGCPGWAIGQVASARIASARDAVAEAGAGEAVSSLADMSPADVWFLTVPDTRISEVAAELSQAIGKKREFQKDSTAIHCSGYHVADVMAPLRAQGWSLASAHPMQSFADPATAAGRFEGTWCGLEGDLAATEMISGLFAAMGARPFPVTSEGKVLYHAAAVFTNNFTTVLQALAREAWEAAGVPADVAQELNTTLLRSTLENVERFGPAAALTGPAARGDEDVVRDEAGRVAEWHPEAGRLYKELSVIARRLKKTGRTAG